MRFAFALWRLKYLFFDRFYCIKYSKSVAFCQYKYFDLLKIGDMHKNAVKSKLSNWDFCALCLHETCPKKAIEDFEWKSPIHFLLCCCYHRGCSYFRSEYAHICSSIFPSYDCANQFLQIHPIQCRTTKIRLHIRHGQNAPIVVCGLIGDIVFEQCPCYIQGNRLRCNLRKPLFLFGGQSDGFYPKRTQFQGIGNYIIKAEDQVAFRAFQEDRV